MTLDGAVTGYQAFSAAYSVGNTLPYVIEAVDGSGNPTGDWEAGIGTYSATSTLTRTTVTASSNAGSVVTLAAGTKNVYVGMPAAKLLSALATQVFGTQTAAAPILDHAVTWNSGGTTFAGWKLNVTDTASASASRLMDLQVGGVSQWNVNKGGRMSLGDQSCATFEIYYDTAAAMARTIAKRNMNLDISGFTVASGFVFNWTTGDGFNTDGGNPGNTDVSLCRDAAGVLAQRKGGITAQAYRVYGTYTDGSNYEYFSLDTRTTANVNRLRASAAGTGTTRLIAIDGFAKAGAPSTSDIPAGTWALVRDTSGATTKLYYNNAGTLQSVALT